MTWLAELIRRVQMFLRREKFDRDMDEEMRVHLELREQEQREAGLSPEEAHTAARKNFGNTLVLREASHESWGWSWLEHLVQDLRYASRMLLKNPGFTAVAVLTLALGIGANTAIFSFINGTLLRGFPYRDSRNLVLLWSSNPQHGWSQNIVSPGDFADWKNESTSFENLSAFDDWEVNLSGTGTPVMAPALRVTPDLFQTLGASPELGRNFRPDEGRPGTPHVVILSHSLWRQRFAGDPAVIGKAFRLNGETFTVIGVMPNGFEFPPAYTEKVELWAPLPFDPASARRDFHQFFVLGRLKPGVSVHQAQSEMNLIARRLQQAYPTADAGWEISIQTLRDSVTGDVRPILLILSGAVGFVLFIACANVSSLQLSRAVVRQKEIAVRAALGAGRRRLVRQFLVESAVLAFLGGALGIGFAFLGVRVVLRFYLTQSPGFEAVGVDQQVLLFTLLLSVATAFIFGVIPALMASRVNLNNTLKEAGRSTTGAKSSHRLRNVLVVVEFALALVLVIGAGLLVKTFAALTHVNPGFDPKNVLTFQLPFGDPRYDAQSARASFYSRLIPQIKSLPGVEAASVITSLPLRGVNGWGFVTEDHPSPAPNDEPDAAYQVIAPDYFRAMRIPLVQGRVFTDADQHNSEPVAVINETLARVYWPGANPVGKRLKIGLPVSKDPWLTVVGIVRDVHRTGLDRKVYPELFVPYTQYPWQNNPLEFVVRSSAAPLQLTATIRRIVAGIDPDQAISEVITMQDVLADSISDRSFNMALLATLAAVALVLAMVGIYGLTSYAVSQRTHEIGVRMALGAQHKDVLRLVLGHGLRLALFGVVMGVIAAVALTRLMSSLLFGVSATDPLTFAGVAILLMLVAMLACYIPARRAMRVDPMVALRYE